ncbi:hypothetical protein Tco_0156945 [Tanacetum coccineum]
MTLSRYFGQGSHKMKAEALKELDLKLQDQSKHDGVSSIHHNVVLRVLLTNDEIEQKNLLIANDNLINDCLSKEVFYIAINSELTVSRFTKMHDAHTVVQARCLKLEAWLSKLHDKVQKDDHKNLYAIDVETIPPHNRNNREVHLDYLKHLKESVETLREIVEEAKVERPLDKSLCICFALHKHSMEQLEYCDWHLSERL